MSDADLWTPSDELLVTDDIAKVKIENPFEPQDLEAAGIVLPELPVDDDVDAAAAAIALAELDEEEGAHDEEELDLGAGAADDDEEIEDAGNEPVDDL